MIVYLFQNKGSYSSPTNSFNKIVFTERNLIVLLKYHVLRLITLKYLCA